MRLFAWRIGHAVQCRDPLIIGPIGHQIADIDGKGAGHIGHGLPFSVLAVHLQSADIGVSMNDGETAVIAMCASANLIFLGKKSRFPPLEIKYNYVQTALETFDNFAQVALGPLTTS